MPRARVQQDALVVLALQADEAHAVSGRTDGRTRVKPRAVPLGLLVGVGTSSRSTRRPTEGWLRERCWAQVSR